MGFPDRLYFQTTDSGEKIFTSGQLSRLWPFGFSSVGDVTFGSAAYVARYHLKKVGSVVSDNHYLDKRSGEMLSPEYVTMSRRPGIGKGWYDKFKLDMYPSGFRIIDGRKVSPARYYDSLFEVDDPGVFDVVKRERLSRVNVSDSSPARLAVKEEVKLAQIRLLSSSLED